MQKNIALLGSTGSIGTQSLDVIRAQGFKVCALAANCNIALLKKQIDEFKPELVAVVDENAFDALEKELQGSLNKPKLLKGKQGLDIIAETANADIVLNAVVGIAGLSSTLKALENGKDVALANKESLVTGGYLVTQCAKKHGAKLLPVDSEHSAIFQCLQDTNNAQVIDKILLTASGGPFFGKTTKDLENVTKEDALRHPNWSMGSKITIDSATLMNKGLELIEAVWLFDLKCEQVEIVVQRQSIIHSMVQFVDNSILAQLGVPDMRIPIQYALTWPLRLKGTAPALDFKSLKSLTFDEADEQTFRCLYACKKAITKGGLAPCAANGANEEAVELFLQDKISFLDIGKLVEAVVDKEDYGVNYSLKDVYDCNLMARAYVKEHI